MAEQWRASPPTPQPSPTATPPPRCSSRAAGRIRTIPRPASPGRETWSAVQPYAKPSAYINDLDEGDEQRTEATYGANYQRLSRSSASTTPRTSSATTRTSVFDRASRRDGFPRLSRNGKGTANG